ncbi:MAG: alpha/beta hydrolase [Ruminococcus sp.]|uniref:alpha/beta fold hydrolase n=1 Tax=Ruminococcus sp. TaxID=41978 RepID=UPI002873073D|nr:alpha/beta hydrolase [Ruminococcus sp.]MBQ3286203.1 alpha/beta hydrolase [Ruminococcus sp.]
METNLVKVGDIEMEYFSFGSGERAFVILPGVDTRSVMLSAMAIQAAYRMFGDEYTVYVFDRRKNMPSPYPVRQMAADTAAVMRELGIKDADIFGASQGGMMAMCIAIDSPELVRSMALGSTAARADDTIIESTERWISLAKSGDMTALTADFIDCLYSQSTIGKYKEFLMHLNDHVSERDIERFIIMTEAIDGFDVFDELDKITCPVLVIGVEGDKVLPCEHSRAIAEKLGCELYLYGEDYGHCAFDEAPDYKQRLLDFFHRV